MTMTRATSRFHAKGRAARRGQGLVEGAMTLVIFLTLVFSVCEFGRAVWSYTMICHATREGSRYAAVHGSQSGMTADTAKTNITSIVKNRAVGLTKSNISVTTTYLPNNTPGNSVKVAVTYPFKFVTPFRLPRNTLTLQSTSQITITN